jgi:hypothetical protein
MHPTVLAEQKDLALKRLRGAAEAIAEKLPLDASLLAGLSRQEKRPEVQELFLVQGLADLMEGIAVAVGAEGKKPEAAALPEPVLEVAETVTVETPKRGRRKA